MSRRRIKFTVGNVATGYKTLEVLIDGNEASYKILRSGLLNVAQKVGAVKADDTWLATLDALNLFAWDKNYATDSRGGLQWRLTFQSGKHVHRSQGSNAFPDAWERFLDCLDALVPEMEFINRRRLEHVTLSFLSETLTLDRRAGTLTIAKKKSRHTYDVGEDVKKLFDACQCFTDNLDASDVDLSLGSCVRIETLRHDGSSDTVATLYNETCLPGLNDFLEMIRAVANDLTAELFEPDAVKVSSDKLILCKVQFKGSYKLYTYRADDETLAVGDVVDVPVGRNNDVSQARISEIGYFDDYEAPIPLDRIKTIIGKHVANDWENF